MARPPARPKPPTAPRAATTAGASPEQALSAYRAKRNFAETPEPAGAPAAPGARLVVQHHFATRDHFDLRLEVDGVLKSWAIARGPSANPRDKRLAVRTEDHPLDYAMFEGLIPKGQYGGGTVILWENATFAPLNGDPGAAIARGEIKFRAFGARMRGDWVLVRMKSRPGEKRENWLLIKERDDFAEPDDGLITRFPHSVATGRSREEIETGASSRVWDSRQNSTDKRGGAQPPRTGMRRTTSPAFVSPSLCERADHPPDGDDYLYEMKYDGYRMQLAVGDTIHLWTRSGLDWTTKFGPIVAAARSLTCASAFIDGEVVVLDTRGLSDFPALVGALEAGRAHAILFMAFDLLACDGVDGRALPLVERKAQLATLLTGAPPALRYASHIVGDGARVFEKAAASGAEGLIAKKASSPYRSGRTSDWLKIKAYPRDDVLIIGYMPAQPAGFRSLLAATPADDGLRYVGRIGTGYAARTRETVWARLRPAAAGPPALSNPALLPRGAVYIARPLRAEIRFGGWTADGQLRQARFLGLRDDGAPAPTPAKETAMPEPKSPPAQSAVAKKSATAPSAAPVVITHPDRVLYPQNAVTKGDVAAYYAVIAPRMRRHLQDRPVSLLRAPDGIDAAVFFQRHPPKGMTRGVIPVPVDDDIYMALDGALGLQSAAQFSTLEVHGWMGRRDKLDHPDRLVFDLDPDEGLPFASVKTAARAIADHLASIGVRSWPMLSGGKGVHVVAPLDRTRPFDEIEPFAAGFARGLARQEPDHFVATMSKARRKGRIFIDWLRNKKAATAIVPWSLRARNGATVALPTTWDALESIDSAASFTIADAPALDDPWEGFFETRQTIPQAALDFVRTA